MRFERESLLLRSQRVCISTSGFSLIIQVDWIAPLFHNAHGSAS